MTPWRKRCLRMALTLVPALALAAGASWTRADDHAPLATRSTGPALKPARPYWIELTGGQRQALTPLADDWERLDVQTKKKWIEIASRYPSMKADEQARTQQRMREWAMLTPDQRRVARDSFTRVQSMNPDQRADMLRKYQELPPERRKALIHEGQASRAIVVPKPKPAPLLVPRRAQISEGAKARNPAIAAQKAANPVAAALPKPVAPPASIEAAPAVAAPPAPAPTVAP